MAEEGEDRTGQSHFERYRGARNAFVEEHSVKGVICAWPFQYKLSNFICASALTVKIKEL